MKRKPKNPGSEFRRVVFSLIALPVLIACSDRGAPTNNLSQRVPVRDTTDWQLVAESATASIVERGQRVFQMCSGCHGIDKGELSPAGPTLYQFAGRRVGVVESYPYTQSMANRAETWTVEQFEAFIVSPEAVYSGTGMAYSGLKSSEDRAALIAFLATKAQQ